jgi:hypothetical protein
MLEEGCWLLVAGSWMLDPGCWLSDNASRQQIEIVRHIWYIDSLNMQKKSIKGYLR